MTVKLRLMRMGKKKQPTYRVVVADSRSPRDGRFIEAVGTYEPRMEPSTIQIDNARVLGWLAKGAQPTETVRKLLVVSGAWEQFESTRPAKEVSQRYARPGRATSPAKKAPAKKAPAKKAAATKAATKSAAAATEAPAGEAEAES
ncbi:MAG: 30S ribosomal protein S16 [Acidimicrobiales bacterium]